LGHVAAAASVQVALSTSSVFPERTPDAFETAARLGYDGVEVMVTADPVSQDADVLRRLSDYHGIGVLAVHAPGLLVTQRVWGRDPWGKLERAREVAEQVGARVVVVHPPFRWQREYARDFTAGLARIGEQTDVVFAVENLYPLRAGGTEVAAWAPHWNPVEIDCAHATLDLSHTAVSGSDALELADQLGGRLAHVHMADGTKPGLPDEHLVPGRGSQPCAELLERLGADGYAGIVVLEVSTFRAATSDERQADLAESLAFTRQHLLAGASRSRASRSRTRSSASLAGTSRADAGRADAGRADAGQADASQADASSADAGRADAGQADASRASGQHVGGSQPDGKVTSPPLPTSRESASPDRH
jgi:sugar phosphate isomerase/epimerase